MKAEDLTIEQEAGAKSIFDSASKARVAMNELFKFITDGVDELGLTEEYVVTVVVAAGWTEDTAKIYVRRALNAFDPKKYRQRAEGGQGRPISLVAILIALFIAGVAGELPSGMLAKLSAAEVKAAWRTAVNYLAIADDKLGVDAKRLEKARDQNPDVKIG